MSVSIRQTLLTQAKVLEAAAELIRLGARMQVLENMTPMPREKLLRLYKEIKGEAPPRGMLPFSTEWFLEWQPAMHSALYLTHRNELRRLSGSVTAAGSGAGALWHMPISYKAYLQSVEACGLEPVLTLTRAWSLERFLSSKMLKEVSCRRCSGIFLGHAHDIERGFICGLCKVPPRAGKTAKAKAKASLDLSGLSSADPS
jgi:flagellar transcriptional activator FlhC